ncbi:MAG: hypothetical protein KA149_07415 [Chitinophagales bacterium]|nr:hypothetical protein [Chitinophagales bacterium]
MPRYQWLICGYLICLAQALNAQWALDPIPGTPPYQKPVAEDTLQVKDFYNSKYSVRVGNGDVAVVGRDTIIVEPLKSNNHYKRLPKHHNDIQIIQQKIIYPQAERISGVQGVCLAYLKVSRRGLIDSVWVDGGLTKGTDNTIIEAIKALNKFTAAHNRGKAVEAVCYYRIRFWIFE